MDSLTSVSVTGDSVSDVNHHPAEYRRQAAFKQDKSKWFSCLCSNANSSRTSGHGPVHHSHYPAVPFKVQQAGDQVMNTRLATLFRVASLSRKASSSTTNSAGFLDTFKHFLRAVNPAGSESGKEITIRKSIADTSSIQLKHSKESVGSSKNSTYSSEISELVHSSDQSSNPATYQDPTHMPTWDLQHQTPMVGVISTTVISDSIRVVTRTEYSSDCSCDVESDTSQFDNDASTSDLITSCTSTVPPEKESWPSSSRTRSSTDCTRDSCVVSRSRHGETGDEKSKKNIEHMNLHDSLPRPSRIPKPVAQQPVQNCKDSRVVKVGMQSKTTAVTTFDTISTGRNSRRSQSLHTQKRSFPVHKEVLLHANRHEKHTTKPSRPDISIPSSHLSKSTAKSKIASSSGLKRPSSKIPMRRKSPSSKILKQHASHKNLAPRDNPSLISTADSASLITAGVLALAETSDLIEDASLRTLDKEFRKLCFNEDLMPMYEDSQQRLDHEIVDSKRESQLPVPSDQFAQAQPSYYSMPLVPWWQATSYHPPMLDDMMRFYYGQHNFQQTMPPHSEYYPCSASYHGFPLHFNEPTMFVNNHSQLHKERTSRKRDGRHRKKKYFSRWRKRWSNI